MAAQQQCEFRHLFFLFCSIVPIRSIVNIVTCQKPPLKSGGFWDELQLKTNFRAARPSGNVLPITRPSASRSHEVVCGTPSLVVVRLPRLPLIFTGREPMVLSAIGGVHSVQPSTFPCNPYLPATKETKDQINTNHPTTDIERKPRM